MSFTITAEDYINYMEIVAEKLAENKDYISELDGITGDGDHWANMNMGFENILAGAGELRGMDMDALFRQIGMIMMSRIGGSSGILYGGAYIAAAKTIMGRNSITSEELCGCLHAMAEDMCTRGNSKPGYKTMIDALYPAAEAYRKALDEGMDDKEILEIVKKASVDGAVSTADMPAFRGRASYRTDKAVGHLDPGAVTMSYQIECLCDYLTAKLNK